MCDIQSAFLRNGIEVMTAQAICDRFDLLGEKGAALKTLYGIYPDRPTSCKTGALDLLNDVRFTMATEDIVYRWRVQGRQVFRYLVDEVNPWQPSARAHHTVDLPLLFGSFDLGFNPGASRVSSEMSTRWIKFIVGQEPWDAGKYFAFGPLGNNMEIGEEEFAARRRKSHCDALRRQGLEGANEVWKALAKGNISLNN
jgi:carboxylesterase type B